MSSSFLEVAQSFVRGESASDSLRVFGVSIEFDAEGLRLEEPPVMLPYEASIADIAVGFLKHLDNGPELQRWARVLLATGAVDLAALEDHPEGDAVLEAVWSAAEGPPIKDATVKLLRRHAEGSSR